MIMTTCTRTFTNTFTNTPMNTFMVETTSMHIISSHTLHHGPARNSPFTIWSLFIIFVLGPCEPLIPLVMFEAITFDWVGLVWVTFLFCIATIAVMMAFVLLASKSLMKLRVKFLEQYIHAIAGYLIAGSGLAIILFGI